MSEQTGETIQEKPWPSNVLAECIDAAGTPSDPDRPRTVREQLERLPLGSLRFIAGRNGRGPLPPANKPLSGMRHMTRQALMIAATAFAFWQAIEDEAEQLVREVDAALRED